MTLHIVNQDHDMFAVSKPGRHELTKEMVGSRYALLTVRLFVDANNPEDITAANALQDRLEVVFRAMDRRSAATDRMVRASTVTTWAEVSRWARRQATILREGLESIHASS